MTWVTVGSVRGWCGHLHRSHEAAKRCLKRDIIGCQSQGGYSDRGVCRQDKVPAHLYDLVPSPKEVSV